jgi:hypothetical protein
MFVMDDSLYYIYMALGSGLIGWSIADLSVMTP